MTRSLVSISLLALWGIATCEVNEKYVEVNAHGDIIGVGGGGGDGTNHLSLPELVRKSPPGLGSNFEEESLPEMMRKSPLDLGPKFEEEFEETTDEMAEESGCPSSIKVNKAGTNDCCHRGWTFDGTKPLPGPRRVAEGGNPDAYKFLSHGVDKHWYSSMRWCFPAKTENGFQDGKSCLPADEIIKTGQEARAGTCTGMRLHWKTELDYEFKEAKEVTIEEVRDGLGEWSCAGLGCGGRCYSPGSSYAAFDDTWKSKMCTGTSGRCCTQKRRCEQFRDMCEGCRNARCKDEAACTKNAMKTTCKRVNPKNSNLNFWGWKEEMKRMETCAKMKCKDEEERCIQANCKWCDKTPGGSMDLKAPAARCAKKYNGLKDCTDLCQKFPNADHTKTCCKCYPALDWQLNWWTDRAAPMELCIAKDATGGGQVSSLDEIIQCYSEKMELRLVWRPGKCN